MAAVVAASSCQQTHTHTANAQRVDILLYRTCQGKNNNNNNKTKTTNDTSDKINVFLFLKAKDDWWEINKKCFAMRPPDRSCVECSTLVIKVSRVVDLLFFFVVFMIFLFHQRHVDMAAARSKRTRAMLRRRNWLFCYFASTWLFGRMWGTEPGRSLKMKVKSPVTTFINQ